MAKQKSASATDDLTKAKIQKESAMVERYEREAATEEARHVLASDEAADAAKAVTYVRRVFANFGATIAPRMEGMGGAEREQLIEGEADKVCRVLAETMGTV
jgi:hypothetical protein